MRLIPYTEPLAKYILAVQKVLACPGNLVFARRAASFLVLETRLNTLSV